MSWMEEIEYAEVKEEQSRGEKEIEGSNTRRNNHSLNPKVDFSNRVKDFLTAYNTLKEIEGMGEDMTEQFKWLNKQGQALLESPLLDETKRKEIIEMMNIRQEEVQNSKERSR